ncbi:Citrate lyase beta subunit [Myroides marinus]|uniref:Citrate lyase beta subunit n=1 Tax=Myroides marinus TaxID=703342 RepID=A0A1H6XVX2_9FLAO|nr:aldolase/citrate lyase family protein [Myroides marinus]SEJ29052.1 Citrate lyase beta subunit [Myroides marinus]
MKSFFFVPGNKLYKVYSVLELGVDELIIDFEDSLLIDQRDDIFKKIETLQSFDRFWYRIPLRNDFNECIDFDFLQRFFDLGVKKIMIPKLISLEEFKEVMFFLKEYDIEIILLVEHPMLYLQLFEVLRINSVDTNKVKGIALGSHDLATFCGFESIESNFYSLRQNILLYCSAFNIEAIDIASMNIANNIEFNKEVLSGVSLGYKAKLVIHPIQVKWLEASKVKEQELLEEARKIVRNIPGGIFSKEINPFVLDGKVIEKPHIENAIKYLKKYENEK